MTRSTARAGQRRVLAFAALALAATFTTLAATAPRAEAGTIVWAGGGSIWAALDDLSYATQIVTPGQVGMTSLTQPHVAHNGSTVVFEGRTNQNNHFYQGTFHCGFSCYGVYRWQNGQAARISAQPNNGSGDVTSFDSEPEATTNGRYVYGFFLCTGYISAQPFTYSCTNHVRDNSLNGGNDRQWYECSGAGSPTPNPVNPNQAAFVGCRSNGTPVLALTASTGGAQIIGQDDQPIRDPSYRSDGQQILTAEDGSGPGIWVNPTNGTGGTLALAAPQGVTFSGPRYMGAAQDRILFAAASNNSSDLWTIPATCTAATCSFPGSATRITTGGGNFAPAWTSQNLIAPPQTGGGDPGGGGTGGGDPGGGGTGGGDTGGGTTGDGTQPPTGGGTGTPTGGGTVTTPGATDPGTGSTTADPAAAMLQVSVPRRVGLRRGRGGRLRVSLTLNTPGQATLALRRGRKTVARGAGRLTGGSSTIVLRLPRGTRAGRYTLVVSVRTTGGETITRRTPVAIVRR